MLFSLVMERVSEREDKPIIEPKDLLLKEDPLELGRRGMDRCTGSCGYGFGEVEGVSENDQRFGVDGLEGGASSIMVEVRLRVEQCETTVNSFACSRDGGLPVILMVQLRLLRCGSSVMGKGKMGPGKNAKTATDYYVHH